MKVSTCKRFTELDSPISLYLCSEKTAFPCLSAPDETSIKTFEAYAHKQDIQC